MDQLPIFVYGTLLPGETNFSAWEDALVRQEAAVFLNGALYDMGGFPMLIEGSLGVVSGMVSHVEPTRYARLLAQLDHLEGFRPHARARSFYLRERRWAVARDGTFVETWIYLGHPTYVAGRPHIVEGDWRRYSELRRT